MKKMKKKIKFVSRESIIDYYLDLISEGIKLNEEQYHLLCELSKD
jgi:hypothetical protein